MGLYIPLPRVATEPYPAPAVPGNWQLVPGNWSLATGPWQLVPGNWSLATGPWQLVPGNWSLATGPWQLATGNWQLATGNWQLATGNWQLATGRCRLDGRAVPALPCAGGLPPQRPPETSPCAACRIYWSPVQRRPIASPTCVRDSNLPPKPTKTMRPSVRVASSAVRVPSFGSS